MGIDFVKRWLGHSLLPVCLLVVAVLLCAPALRNGWVADDAIHNAMLNPHHPIKTHGFYQGMENFPSAIKSLFVWFRGDLTRLGIDYGPLPWWTHPDSQQSFWRPLSAATHWVDTQLWPSSPLAMHLHSAVWYGGLVLVVALAYRRMVSSIWVAGLAALLFAINQEGYQATCWIAARNSVLAAFFVALTVWFYHNHVQRRSVGWGLGALGALAAGFLAGEAAVAAVVYLFSYTMMVDERPWSARLISLAPSLVLLVVWRVVYQAMGYGALHSGLYVDPGQDPVRYLFNLIEWAPLVVLNTVTGPLLIPYASLAPALKLWAWAGGSLLILVIAVAFLPLLRAERAARFWAMGVVLAVIPACATTVPSGRSTLGVMFGLAPLAALFMAGVAGNAAWIPGKGMARRSLQVVAVLLFTCHVLLPLPGHAKRLLKMVAVPPSSAASVDPVFRASARELVVVTSPDVMFLPYVPFLLAQDGYELPSRLRVLSSSIGAVVLRRTGTNVLAIASTGAPLIPTRLSSSDGPRGAPLRHPLYHTWLLSTAFRADGLRFKSEEKVMLPGLIAEVIRVNAQGAPLEVTFTFARALEDARYKWIRWDTARAGYVPFTPPGAGEERILQGLFREAKK